MAVHVVNLRKSTGRGSLPDERNDAHVTYGKNSWGIKNGGPLCGSHPKIITCVGRAPAPHRGIRVAEGIMHEPRIVTVTVPL